MCDITKGYVADVSWTFRWELSALSEHGLYLYSRASSRHWTVVDVVLYAACCMCRARPESRGDGAVAEATVGCACVPSSRLAVIVLLTALLCSLQTLNQSYRTLGQIL